MATPNYKGTGHPSNGGSWLGSWLGGTPSYKTVDKGSSYAAGYTGAGPAYKPAPAAVPVPAAASVPSAAPSPDVSESAEQNDTCGCGPIAIVIPREVIEQE